MKINISFSGSQLDWLTNDISGLSTNEDLLSNIHTQLAKMCDPYVPMENSDLARDITISSNGVTYNSPYAHYQYMGIVYGPNLPQIENGVVTGWRSRKPKSPTNRKLGTEGYLLDDKGNVMWEFGYTKDYHPLATSKWDKQMLNDKGDEFYRFVENAIMKELKKDES